MVCATAADHDDTDAAIDLHIMHIDLSSLVDSLLNDVMANFVKLREPASKLTQQWFSADHCSAPQRLTSHQALLSSQLDSMLVWDSQLNGQASTCSHVTLWQTPISTSCKRKATIYRGDMRLLFIPVCV